MKVAILGAGSWGTALALVLMNNGHEVMLWSKFQSELDEISEAKENRSKLPGIILPDHLLYNSDIEAACQWANILVMAVPSKFVRSTAHLAAPYITEEHIIVNVAKGIEDESRMTLDRVIKEEVPKARVAILSGPSHAEEVAREIPTSVVVGSTDDSVIRTIQDLFMNQFFRIYGSADVLGIEIGGALKNVIALAAGISDGLGFGDNSKAALMTRGMAEISRLGEAMGADPITFHGLSGIGDLIVTCTSMHSRNRRAGILIGQGKSMDEALNEVQMVVEGVYSAHAGMELAKEYHVEMPIITMVNRILFENFDPKQAVIDLMNRDRKFEI